MHTFFHWVWAKMAIGFICSCILRSYFYGLVVERCRRFLLQDRQLCVKRRAEQVERLWCEIPVCPGAVRPGDSQMCRLAVPPMQQNWRHPPLFFILFPLYLFKIGLCCNQLFQHNPQHVSGFSKPDLPHARMLPRWALEITAMKYVGYVYALALALGCSSFISTAVQSRLLPSSPGLSKQCSRASSRLGASCGLTSSISRRVNYICVMHFTEWGKNSSERLLAWENILAGWLYPSPISMGCWCSSPGHDRASFGKLTGGLAPLTERGYGVFSVNHEKAIGVCLH